MSKGAGEGKVMRRHRMVRTSSVGNRKGPARRRALSARSKPGCKRTRAARQSSSEKRLCPLIGAYFQLQPGSGQISLVHFCVGVPHTTRGGSLTLASRTKEGV